MSELRQWENATSIAEMERGVAALRGVKAARTLPILASYDRRAVGIVRLLLFGVLRIALGLFLLYVAYRTCRFLIPLLLQIPRLYIAEVAGERWSIAWFLLVVLLAIPYLVFSTAIRDVLVKQNQKVTSVLRLVANLITYFLIAIWLVIAMMPVAFALLAMAYAGWINQAVIWESIAEVQYGWAYTLGLIVILLLCSIPIIRSLFKKQSGWRPLLLFMLWVGGAFLWAMNWLANERMVRFPPIELPEQLVSWLAQLELMPFVVEFNQWLIEPKPAVIIWGIAGLAYPLGYGLWLSQWPARFLLYLTEAVERVARHVRLRWHIAQLARTQRQHNNAKTKGTGWATVCREHRKRFVSHSEKMSYGRWLHFAACPHCHDDEQVWTGVQGRALWFDKAVMEKEPVLENGTLFASGLAWIASFRNSDEARNAAIWFDAIVVGDVPEVDIEEFLTIYHGISADKPLNQLSAHLLPTHNLPTNITRQLEATLAHVETGYDPTKRAACLPRLPQRMAQKETRTKRNRNVRFAMRAALQYGLFVGAVWVGWQLWQGENVPFVSQIVSQVLP